MKLDRRSMLRWGAGAAAVGALAACSQATDSSTPAAGGAASAEQVAQRTGAGVFDATRLHTLDIAMSDNDFQSIMTAYQADRTKDWVEATVTIDGTAYDRCGVRLKGNSTIWRVPTGATASEYPWLVRLDKFVDGQAHEGVTEIVVRLNNTTTALNEALSLDLLARAGLASEPWCYAAVSVAGAAPVLRLILEQPSKPWVKRTFAADGILYKAEAQGNYDYLGDDPAAYDDRFDVEAGEDDLAPLIAFLKWVNEVDDTGFASGLAEQVEVDAFATYLALEDLIGNYDAMDGPGNNSYLWRASSTKRMTVVGWDHNLTFGVSNRPGGGQGLGGQGLGGQGGGGRPGAGEGMGGGGANRGNQSGNVLSRRFEATPALAQLKTAATQRLREDLFTSGYAAQRLERAASVLTSSAGQFVAADTVAIEKAAIAAYFG